MRRRAFVFLLLAGCTPRAAPASPQYLALGDSYTIGEGVPEADAYPRQWARRVGWPPPKIVARTGWTSHDLLEAARDLDGTYARVTLHIGANDAFQNRSLQRYEQDLTALLTLAIARAGGQPRRVVVISIPDFSVVPAMRGRSDLAATIPRFNAAAKALAESRGTQWVSVVAESQRMANDPRLVASDGLHPSGAMYARWSELIARVVSGPTP